MPQDLALLSAYRLPCTRLKLRHQRTHPLSPILWRQAMHMSSHQGRVDPLQLPPHVVIADDPAYWAPAGRAPSNGQTARKTRILVTNRLLIPCFLSWTHGVPREGAYLTRPIV